MPNGRAVISRMLADVAAVALKGESAIVQPKRY